MNPIVVAVPMLALMSLAGCTQPTMSEEASNPNTLGATGRTIVPGNTSSIAADAVATEQQQKWGAPGRGR
jgi:hypothetical protein